MPQGAKSGDSSSLRITNKQVYDLLNELSTEVKLINQKLDNEIVKNDKLIADHELRIRKIEETVWRSAWITSITTAIITSAAGAIIIAVILQTNK